MGLKSFTDGIHSSVWYNDHRSEFASQMYKTSQHFTLDSVETSEQNCALTISKTLLVY